MENIRKLIFKFDFIAIDRHSEYLSKKIVGTYFYLYYFWYFWLSEPYPQKNLQTYQLSRLSASYTANQLKKFVFKKSSNVVTAFIDGFCYAIVSRWASDEPHLPNNIFFIRSYLDAWAVSKSKKKNKQMSHYYDTFDLVGSPPLS